MKLTFRKTCPANILMRSNLTFDSFLKVNLGSTTFKGPKTCLLLLIEFWDANLLQNLMFSTDGDFSTIVYACKKCSFLKSDHLVERREYEDKND